MKQLIMKFSKSKVIFFNLKLMRFFFVFYFYATSLFSQQFLKVNQREISYNDFLKTHEKSLQLLGVEKTIHQAIEFELMKDYALSNGVEEHNYFKVEFQNRYGSYKQENFIPKKVTDSIIQFKAERLKKERKIQVLFINNPNYSKTSTLKKKIEKIHSEIISGKIAFEDAVQKFTELTDYKVPSYVRAFELDWRFEDFIFSLPIGQVSSPFIGDNFLALVKVLDEREASGVLVLQEILVEGENAQFKSDSIYKALLNKSLDFNDAVKKFSASSKTLSNGILPKIETALLDEIYEVIHGKQKDFISPPIYTPRGWKIFRILDKLDYQKHSKELYQYIDEKLQMEQFFNIFHPFMLKDVLKYKSFEKNLRIWNIVTSLLKQKKYKSVSKYNSEWIVSFDGFAFTVEQVMEQLVKDTEAHSEDIISQFEFFTEKFWKEEALRVYGELFDQKPETLEAIQQIKEDLYVQFFIAKIESDADGNLEGLKHYYENNKQRYSIGRTAISKAKLFLDDTIYKRYKDLKRKKLSDEEILKQLNANLQDQKKLNAVFSEVTLSEQASRLPAGFKFEKGIQIIKSEAGVFEFNVSEIIENYIPPFEQIQDKVKLDHRQFYLKYTLENLKKSANIQVNSELKAQLLQTYRP